MGIKNSESIITRPSVASFTNLIHYHQWPQFLAGFLAHLCCFSFGLNYGWSSPSVPILLSDQSPVPVTLTEVSWIASIQPLGNIVGAPISAFLCDIIGRKKTILLTTIPHFIGWNMIAFATTPVELIIARFFTGMAEGAIYLCVPIYIGEISESKVRGVIGSGMTLSIIFGVLVINIVGGLNSMKTTALLASAVPIFTLMTFSWMPDSPYFCVMRNRFDLAKANLRRLRGVDEIEKEFVRICKTVERQMEKPATFKTVLTIRENRKAWFIMVGIRIIQQMSGISAMTYYLLPIFNETGMSLSPLIATVGFIVAEVIATGFCTLFVDRFGRVPLLIISLIGGSLSLFVIGTYFFYRDFLHLSIEGYQYVPLVGMLCYIVTFSLGYGTLPSLMASELFATNIKSKALCLTHFIFASFVFFASKTFLYLQKEFGMFVPFWLYGMCAFLGIFYTWFFVPETKGKSLEEIQKWMKT